MSCETRVHASAPGKAILLGEHAVVYGQPALATPIPSLRARATAWQTRQPLILRALDLDRRFEHRHEHATEPLAELMRLVVEHLKLETPTGHVELESDIPIASGMGSGAAVSAAVARVIARLHGQEIADAALNRIVYAVEGLHHGTPSGIDNTVVVYETPILFRKGVGFQRPQVRAPCHFIVADTGCPASTRESVARLRRRRESSPAETDRLLARIGHIVAQGKDWLESGDMRRFGESMQANQRLLRRLGVSSPELETLIDAAMQGGALGAKLSGGGMGGNMIALVDAAESPAVAAALKAAGAARILPFTLRASERDS